MIEIEFEVGRWRVDGFNIVKRHQHTNQLRLFSSALCVLCHDSHRKADFSFQLGDLSILHLFHLQIGDGRVQPIPGMGLIINTSEDSHQFYRFKAI